MRKALTAVFLLLIPFLVYADTFIVTSNADSGPGTLRDALQKAADNGTAVPDKIIFNIADVTTAGRTIILQSVLPDLTGNLLIDGTTQPGVSFGKSNARVELTIPRYPAGASSLLFMHGVHASDIEIDGLFFYQPFCNSCGVDFQAIELYSCNNLQIGRPSKGNYFLGFTETIFGDTINNISIQGNIDGLNLDGTTSYQSNNGLPFYYSNKAIDFENAFDIMIGGENSGEANYIEAQSSIDIEQAFSTDSTYIKIYNNRLGTDSKDSIISDGDGRVMPSNIVLRSLSCSVDIRNNILSGNISISSLTKYFKITGNKIYNPNYLASGSAKISIGGTAAGGMIGGGQPGEGNQIFYESTLGDYAISSDNTGVTIFKNNIYCNQTEGSPVIPNWIHSLDAFDDAGRTFPWVLVDSTAPGFVKGRALKNCKIDIYQDDECPACEGKTYIASTVSDANGNWLYKGAFTGVVVATATDNAGTTFAFSYPFVRDVNMQIKQPSCGKKNGSIKAIQVIGGDNWEWHKTYIKNNITHDSMYSTRLDLDSAEAGTYILRPKLGATCNGLAKKYTLTDLSPKLDTTAVKITQPGCGQGNGAITGMRGSGVTQSKLEWHDEQGNVVGNQFDISNLYPGQYTLYAIDTSGGGCIAISQAYVLTNQSGPSLKTSAVLITNASCGKSNGSIKHITYQNATGNKYITWLDSSGNIAGNNIDLLNVPAGRYRLKFKDAGNCDTIVTEYFLIAGIETIGFDTSRMVVTSSSCKGADGGIKNITSINAATYTWVNTATGATVGSAEDINGIPPGSYQLKFGNARGCTEQTNPIQVGQSGFLADSITKEIISDPNCDLDNGYVQPLIFTKDTSQYTFEWRDAAGNILSTNTSVYNLKPGRYTLFATDINGCRQAIFSTPVVQRGKPAFIYTGVQIINDTCGAGRGAIQNLQLTDVSHTYTWAWFTSSQQSVSSNPSGIGGLTAGNYYTSVIDQFNCTITSDTFTVNDYTAELAAPQAADQYIPRGFTASINIANVQPGTYYLFDTVNAIVPVNSSLTGTFITPPVYYNKLFYVQLMSGNCRSAVQQVWVKVFDSTKISIPNAFSPNGDGINDTWRLQAQRVIANYKLEVFNRYGQIVFTADNINKPWDGTLAGKPLPVGTYYYIIQGKDDFNKPVKLKGFVMILR